ncbi:imelysin [Leptospira wolffii]|uniref:imelysin family protein n=1 Tax=Leptospira wolffii TaxID=409998 RepID=UPI0003458B69|nr:imelysin family protein [Leptospira wolffii]TGK58187.1 imelysin [Leptospira wolffii]TGK67405.1 imelysin [Leptospira wolffii]TGK68865.1 imelysin [Leptospira wolffii]TGL27217.1 imelysin [Leptospira wolffii]
MRNIQTKIASYLLAAPLSILLFACGGGSGGSDGLGLALAALNQPADPVLVRYADLAYESYDQAIQDAISLQTAVATFVATPTSGNLTAARNAWVVSRSSYLVTEPFRFSGGPIDADPGHCGGTAPSYSGSDECEGAINAWPLDEIVIDNYIATKASDGSDLTFDDLYSKNEDPTLAAGGEVGDPDQVVMTGYHAIEYLLWGKDTGGSPAGVNLFPGLRTETYFTDATSGTRRKKYLTEVVKGLVGHLTQVRNQWSGAPGSYRYAFYAGGRNSKVNVFNGLGQFIASEWGGDRLQGITSGVQEDEHSCFSDTTKADFYYDAQGFLNIWTGNYSIVKGVNISTGPGLSTLVQSATSNFIIDDATQARDIFCINLSNETSDPNYTLSCASGTITERYDQIIMKSANSTVAQQNLLDDLQTLLSTTLVSDFATAITQF